MSAVLHIGLMLFAVVVGSLVLAGVVDFDPPSWLIWLAISDASRAVAFQILDKYPDEPA